MWVNSIKNQNFEEIPRKKSEQIISKCRKIPFLKIKKKKCREIWSKKNSMSKYIISICWSKGEKKLGMPNKQKFQSVEEKMWEKKFRMPKKHEKSSKLLKLPRNCQKHQWIGNWVEKMYIDFLGKKISIPRKCRKITAKNSKCRETWRE